MKERTRRKSRSFNAATSPITLKALLECLPLLGKSRNIVALGYLAGLFRLDRAVFHDTIAAKFRSKPADVTESNQAAFDLGYDLGAGLLNLGINGFSAAPQRRNGAGLVMMSVINNSYSNVVSSFFSSKFQRNVEEMLVSPMHNSAILLGYMSGGIVRAMLVARVSSS